MVTLPINSETSVNETTRQRHAIIKMFYKYVRTIYGWKEGEEEAQRGSVLDTLRELGLDNAKLYKGMASEMHKNLRKPGFSPRNPLSRSIN